MIDPRLMYKDGEPPRYIHNVDASGWLANGWSYEPSADVVESVDKAIAKLDEVIDALTPTVEASPALLLINTALTAEEIAVLPTIGKASANKIFANRPKEGYASFGRLAELNEAIAKAPYNVSWQQVNDWAGE